MKRFERSNGLDTALFKNYLYFSLKDAVAHTRTVGRKARSATGRDSLEKE